MSIQDIIASARKIVLKYGSNTLAGEDGRINVSRLGEIAEDAAALMKQGKQIVIVSSGAQAAGLSTMGAWARKKDIHYRQALCAVGQVELMDVWRKAFEDNHLHIGQLLLTNEDFGDKIRSLNMRNTLFTLTDEGIIPIINENDSVSVDEIKIGENDTLAARSAALWSADLLILFSDIDGLFDKNPKTHSDARLVEEVTDIEKLEKQAEDASTSSFGTGGIVTKIEAAKIALSYGLPMILANGGKTHALQGLASGTLNGTLFK
ncbi:MAG: glutamate 5-kinase [Spirochaetaceae bacterium]|nr:glutamate 5-kinase [Spirochaetaceae bacterium]